MFVGITKDDKKLVFSSQNNKQVSVSVFRKDSKDNSYYPIAENVQFTTTNEYILHDNHLYKFVFKYRGDSERIPLQNAQPNRPVPNPVVVQKEFIEEYNVGYYPHLLDNIITGCYYVLNSTEDIGALYTNKDRIANSVILRMMYYNSLCMLHCNHNMKYTIDSLYYKLLHHNNIFEMSELHRGLDNTFIQEKIIIGTYYVAYLLDALKMATDKNAILKQFRFSELSKQLRLINIDLSDLGKYVGLQLSVNTQERIEVRDVQINLSNRETYRFKQSDFSIGAKVPTHITFVSIPTEGVLRYADRLMTLGQRIPYADIGRVSYTSKDVDGEYSTLFKFILE